MVPSTFELIDMWPLTTNGKIDKKRLPEPDTALLQYDIIAPETEMEKSLAEVWSKLLNIGVDSVSIDSSFFDLGGHSLLSVRLVSDVRKHFKIELSVQSVFEYPTLQAMALVLEKSPNKSTRKDIKRVERTTNTATPSFSQQRLWFLNKLQGATPEYNLPIAFTVKG
ncbi:hypothetical protein CJF42_26330, partial [Pseudoalteromonas sp. NBT06-2]